MDNRSLPALSLALSFFAALSVAVYSCAVNPVTGRPLLKTLV